jgi:hypothetical protein
MRFALGALAALTLAGASAEVFLRLSPPEDLFPYLGDRSPLTGQLVPGDDFGVRFATLADLIADNPQTLGAHSPLLQGSALAKPIRLFLGSSFGFNLGHRLHATRADIGAVVLDRREPLHVRMAQLAALADANMPVDRAYLVLTPIDFKSLGEHGQPFAAFVDNSRLAFTAWARMGWHLESPQFRMRHLTRNVSPQLKSDIDHMFASLARIAREREFPITVVPLPMRPEVVAGRPLAIDDAVIEAARLCGLDIVDLWPEFLAHPRKHDLYIADGHYSELGDDLVLAALERHHQRAVHAAPVSRPGGAPR